MIEEIIKRKRGRPLGSKCLTKYNRPPKNKKIVDYDIYGVGSNRKLEWKGSLQSHSIEDAEYKAKRFAIVGGFTFSHAKLK
jgi:hypothetical protein